MLQNQNNNNKNTWKAMTPKRCEKFSFWFSKTNIILQIYIRGSLTNFLSWVLSSFKSKKIILGIRNNCNMKSLSIWYVVGLQKQNSVIWHSILYPWEAGQNTGYGNVVLSQTVRIMTCVTMGKLISFSVWTGVNWG